MVSPIGKDLGQINFMIPARSGSTRIPNKNIKDFLGIPIIVRTIESLKKISQTSKIYVSTDSLVTSDLVKNYGAIVPFLRESKISTNNTPTIEVIKDFISRVKLHGESILICIYPTSIFVTEKLIFKTIKALEANNNSVIMPIIKFPSSPERKLLIDEQHKITFTNSALINYMTQNLQDYFYDSSTFYAAKVSTWSSIESFYSNSVGLEIKSYDTVDINTQDDWDLAEFLFKAKNILE
jgi:pseudaminic acid cytidylyltransferase